MSDEGEKTCPLCAEEMDLTDQQLKPCNCGYEICVWCWHQIMDMAEKNGTEGRCPACRTAYNKEKIVGTAAICERLVSEMNVEKKKVHKGRSKPSEGRKQLASVRVIQKNLVYVVGLPLNFSDEDLLQRKEYFGQYGKVLKVSVSQTAAGAIQHTANSTCSVYITYSKEEEAVRCIQSVHGFILDGRSLRACFGTTKYCHAWLRNVPCSNPDCLYLHEIGSQEDSFTKDETISAYTRVQQITGSASSTQRRAGNVLPPPADEYCNNTVSSGKPITKTTANANNLAANARVSPPKSSSSGSTALPAGALWGTRSANNQPSLRSMQCSHGPVKQKLDVCSGPVGGSTAAERPSEISSLHNDTEKILVHSEGSSVSQNKSKTGASEPIKRDSEIGKATIVSGNSLIPVHSTSPMDMQPPPTQLQPNSTNVADCSITSGGLDDSIDATDSNMENVCSHILSMGINENQILENDNTRHIREPLVCQTSGADAETNEVGLGDVQPGYTSRIPTQLTQVDLTDTEDDFLSFLKQRPKNPNVASDLSKHSCMFSSQFSNADDLINTDLNGLVLDRNANLVVSTSNFPSGHNADILESPELKDFKYYNLFKETSSPLGRSEGEVANGVFDIGESSIISNILSMDFDTWDENVNSPHNMGKLIGQTDKLQGHSRAPGPLKIQTNNQSRFSFAREVEPTSQVSDFGQSIDNIGKGLMQHSLGHDFSIRNELHLDRFGGNNGYPDVNATDSVISSGNHSDIRSHKLSVPRSQISAPPGFSVPSRAPPPGFNYHGRTDQNFDQVSGNHMLDVSSMLMNHSNPLGSNTTITNGDIEFMDPAILAVGKETLPNSFSSPHIDLRSNYSSQLNTYEEAARFQSLLQRSLPQYQNQRFSNVSDGYSPFGDARGIPSRVLEQTLANNFSPFSQFGLPQSRNGLTSNGQWDSWNEIQGRDNMGIGELLRTERLGYNSFYSGHEDSKIQMRNSGNIYNGTYGI